MAIKMFGMSFHAVACYPGSAFGRASRRSLWVSVIAGSRQISFTI